MIDTKKVLNRCMNVVTEIAEEFQYDLRHYKKLDKMLDEMCKTTNANIFCIELNEFNEALKVKCKSSGRMDIYNEYISDLKDII